MEAVILIAKNLYDHDANTQPLANHFESVADALNSMSNVIAFEAHKALREENAPLTHQSKHKIRAGVDFDTPYPGLWLNNGSVLILDAKGKTPPPPKRRFNPEVEQRRAATKLQKMKQKLVVAQEEGKASRGAPQRKRQKKTTRQASEEESKLDTDNLPSPSTSPGLQQIAVVGEVMDPGAEATAKKHYNRRQLAKSWQAWFQGKAGGASLLLPGAQATTTTVPPGSNDGDEQEEQSRIPPPKLQEKPSCSHATLPSTPIVTAKHRIFPNPLPFVRSYQSLDLVDLHPCLRGGMLRNEHCTNDLLTDLDGIHVVQGPPGTGKTRYVVEHLERMLALPTIGPSALRRVLICSQTNDAVDHLWECFQKNGGDSTPKRRNGKANKCVILRMTQNGIAAGENRHPASLASVRGKLVVFATVACRNGNSLRDIDFDAILVDEASLIPEYDSWSILRAATRHLLLVGDHQQLGPTSSPSGTKLGHDRSLMRRLVENGFPAQFLAVQYRMVPKLGNIVSETYYGGKLQNAADLPKPVVVELDMVDVKGEMIAVGTSYRNDTEASECVDLSIALSRQLTGLLGRVPSVAILSPYSAQNEQVCKLLSVALGDQGGCLWIQALTVDSSQGREYDAVIINTTRRGLAMGFWSNRSRFLVALTRARFAVRVVGDKQSWSSWDNAIL